ncbi:MAG: hypothetical protein R3Y13_02900 [bacterium]
MRKRLLNDMHLKSNDTLTITEEEYSNFLKRPTTTLTRVENFIKVVSNDENYNQILNYYKNENLELKISYIKKIQDKDIILYDSIKNLKEYIKDSFEAFDLTTEERNRIDHLNKIIYIDHYFENKKDDIYEITIDNMLVRVPVRLINLVLTLGKEDLETLLNDKDVSGIKKEHLMHATYAYCEKYVINKYEIPSKIEKRIFNIKMHQLVDTQSLNLYLENTDTLYKKLTLNTKLKEAILSGMPEDYNLLEKSIHMYLNMCNLLTYDEAYYASDDKNREKSKHTKLEYIEEISLDNNKIVCFEFILMYTHLLDELGIKFITYYQNMEEINYGKGHVNASFRIDKFLINVDPLTSIHQGDIVQVKLNQPISGIICENFNNNTNDELVSTIDNVYNNFLENNNSKLNKKLISEDFQKLVFKEKLILFNEKIKENKLTNMDFMSYLIQLKKVLFTQKEHKSNISMLMIIENINENINSRMIVSINDGTFLYNIEDTIYYISDDFGNLIEIKKEAIEDNFNTGIYMYTNEYNNKIPGIIEGKGRKFK